MVNTEITKFTKLYVSNKNSNQKLYFAIDYEIRIIKYNNEQTTTSIILYISYLYLEKDFCLRKAEARPNKWEFSSSSNNKSCSLHSSVMINIKSYGVGTFVLNEIIKIANEYTPNASLEGFLSPVDEGEDNIQRRDSLYRNIGFNIEPNRFYIEKISDLILDRKLEYIQTLNYSNIFDLLCTLQDEKVNLERDLKNKKIMYQEKKTKKNKCNKKIKYIIVSFIILFSIILAIQRML